MARFGIVGAPPSENGRGRETHGRAAPGEEGRAGRERSTMGGPSLNEFLMVSEGPLPDR